MFNRSKRSICLNLKSQEGKNTALELIRKADILIENFRPGAMDKLGFGYEDIKKENDNIIYCSEKGFLSGPYENRTALDEVAQMMGGLAYMTGPPGQPLRAGSSVIDITGGMFGVIGILAAIIKRNQTGEGQQLVASLYETTVYLVGQHMAQYGVTGKPANPMPARVSAWAIYDVFNTKDEDKVFVGVVSDTQWEKFCKAFDLKDLWKKDELKTNNGRVDARPWLKPHISDIFNQYTKLELMEKLDKNGIPFAPITKPHELFDDKHLSESEGLSSVTLTDGKKSGDTILLPNIPITFSGKRLKMNKDLPKKGEHTRQVLVELGYNEEKITKMISNGTAAGE